MRTEVFGHRGGGAFSGRVRTWVAGHVDPVCWVVLLVIGGWMFFRELEGGISLWDEAYYATVAKRSLESGSFLFPSAHPGVPSDKPALYFWFLEASYALFGCSGTSTRLPSSLGAFASILLLYAIVRKEFDRSTGLIAAFLLMTSRYFLILPRNSLLDPLMLAFQLAFVRLSLEGSQTRAWQLVGGAFFLGLALFLKQFLGVSVFLPVLVYWIYTGSWPKARLRVWALSVLVFLVAGCGWYFVAYLFQPETIKWMLFDQNLSYRFTVFSDVDPLYTVRELTRQNNYGQSWHLIQAVSVFTFFWALVEWFRKPSGGVALFGSWMWAHVVVLHLAAFQAAQYGLALYPCMCVIGALMLQRFIQGQWNGVDLAAVSWAAGSLAYSKYGQVLKTAGLGVTEGKVLLIAFAFGLVFMFRWPKIDPARKALAVFFVALFLWSGADPPPRADWGTQMKETLDRVASEEGSDVLIRASPFAYYHVAWYHAGPSEILQTGPEGRLPIPPAAGYVVAMPQEVADWPSDQFEEVGEADMFKVFRYRGEE